MPSDVPEPPGMSGQQTFGVFGMHTFGHPPDLRLSATGHMTTAAYKIGPVPAPDQGHDGPR
ncbi:hypothetical protein [Micromonospora sp. NPDC050200]|uniref:hypothetical protein n=1 Tax=Micromonospora sp. NPDC050200 TaxID=3155664 RepID=UPI0033CF0AC7